MTKIRASALMAIGLLSLAISMRFASAPTANLSYLLIAVYALAGRAQAIQALCFSWLFTMLSPGIAPDATYGALGRYAVLACAALSVLIRSGILSSAPPKIDRMVLATLLLGLGICFHALFFSLMKDISLLKAVSWTVASATLISGWSALSTIERNRLEKQIFVGLAVLMLLSLPLLASGIGYLRNDFGFQGIMSHPQAFGPTMALLGAWAIAYVVSSDRPPFLMMGLIGVSLLLIVLSEARTAGFALVLALFVSVLAIKLLTRDSLRRLFPALTSKRFHALAFIGLGIIILGGPTLSGVVTDYVVKRGDASDVIDAYDRSRGALIDAMWNNISSNPWAGIGFGVASIPEEMEVTRDPVFDLPIGASIEKGVLPLAILEELGILGAAAVLVWIWMIVRRSVRGRKILPLFLVFLALLLNMGEMMLFSPGGMGLLMLVILGYAASQRVNVSAERMHNG